MDKTFEALVRGAIWHEWIPEADPETLWSGKVCARCGGPLFKEFEIKDYPYFCPLCDENMFEIESKDME